MSQFSDAEVSGLKILTKLHSAANSTMEDDLDRILSQIIIIDARILSDHASLANSMSEVEKPSEVETPSPTAVEEIPQRFALTKQ